MDSNTFYIFLVIIFSIAQYAIYKRDKKESEKFSKIEKILNEENKLLKKEIIELIKNPDSATSNAIKLHYVMKSDLEDAVFYGEVSEIKKFNGLFPLLKDEIPKV